MTVHCRYVNVLLHCLSNFCEIKLMRVYFIDQKIQQITRYSAQKLANYAHLEEFTKLIKSKVKFVSSFDEVSPTAHRLYHRKTSAMQAKDDFVNSTLKYLSSRGRASEAKVVRSKDQMKLAGSRQDLQVSNDPVVTKLLDQKVRESRQLLFFKGALFEATRNVGDVLNSQIMIMLDVPSDDDIAAMKPITLYSAPEGSPRPTNLYHEIPPSKEEVLNVWKWKEVKISPAKMNLHRQGLMEAYREQYTIAHLGASTVSY